MPKKGRGKQKGNSFENDRAKELSKWITRGERIDIFERSSSSGAKATIHKKQGTNAFVSQCGDIASSDPIGESLTKYVMVECKHYRDMGYLNLLFGGKGGIVQFWKKLLEECEEFKKEPMLVCRQNNRPILLGTNRYLVRTLELQDLVLAYYPNFGMYLLLWDAFLQDVDPIMLTRLEHEVHRYEWEESETTS